ncbi:hypothetical protein [uncultured Cohaesibacter sp.]|uniref:hypothetical protein n=1 Tax=uncultured Cohaesibacter sp. TaxID=1002546 RepID=UPI002AA68F20|nr:hypothetical protein [uncultured Cohaesibacter sp.]
MRQIFTIGCLVLLAGCASSSVMPVNKNTIIITTSADSDCGQAGAQKVALKMAAIETIRRGYEEFAILGSRQHSDVRLIGQTPIYSNTTISGTVVGNSVFGSANTTYYGGDPLYGGSFSQGLAVRLLPEGSGGVDAKDTLGKDWEKIVKKDVNTCL